MPICSGRPSTLLGMSTISCGSALKVPGVVTLLGPWSSQLPGYTGLWARAAVAGRASSAAAVMIRIVRMSGGPRAGSVTADLGAVASRPRDAGDAQADDATGRAAEVDRRAQAVAGAPGQHARPPAGHLHARAHEAAPEVDGEVAAAAAGPEAHRRRLAGRRRGRPDDRQRDAPARHGVGGMARVRLDLRRPPADRHDDPLALVHHPGERVAAHVHAR